MIAIDGDMVRRAIKPDPSALDSAKDSHLRMKIRHPPLPECDRWLCRPSCLGFAEARRVHQAFDGQRIGADRRVAVRHLQIGKGSCRLLRFDLIEGRSGSELKKILDVTHEVLIDTLSGAETRSLSGRAAAQASSHGHRGHGLGFVRSDKIVVLQITSRPRKREMKQAFYRLLVERLSRQLRNSTNRRGRELCDER